MRNIASRAALIVLLSACSPAADTSPSAQDIASLVRASEPDAKVALLACQKSKELAGFNCDYTVAQCTDAGQKDCSNPEARNSRFVLGEAGWAIAGGVVAQKASPAPKTATDKDASNSQPDGDAKDKPAAAAKIAAGDVEGFWTPESCDWDFRYALYSGGRLRIDLGNQFMEDGSRRRVGFDGTWSLDGDTLTLRAPQSLGSDATTGDWLISDEPTNDRIKVSLSGKAMNWKYSWGVVTLNRCDALNN